MLHPPSWPSSLAWCLVLSRHWQRRSRPSLPCLEAGDRRLVVVGADRETSECSPWVAVGNGFWVWEAEFKARHS